MKTRNFLIGCVWRASLVGWVLWAALVPAGADGRTADRPPNILFLLTDDQRADTLGSMGHPIIRTPNLDRLADTGVLFTRAFVTDPTCKPSRAAYFTGQYERVHRVGFSSRHAMTEQQWAATYPALLRRAGYYTGFIGKFGIETYVFRGEAKKKFDYWRAHDGWARFWPKPRPNCSAYRNAKADIITPIMAECVEDFLAARDRTKPFCLSVSFSAPHGSISTSMDSPDGKMRREAWMTRPANLLPQLQNHPIYGALYRDREIRLPDSFPDPPGRHIPLAVHDPAKGRSSTYCYDFEPARCREHHVRYYQLVRGLDTAVGRIVEALRAAGVADNTVILYSSDHGLLLGEYGMGGKGLCYDLTTRVPLVVFDPRLPQRCRGRKVEELVLSIDLAPTILSLAGVGAPAGMQGRDLTPLLKGKSPAWRDAVFLENLYLGRDGPFIEAVRTADWKYARFFKPGAHGLPKGLYEHVPDFRGRKPDYEQLFDLKHDPGETSNLAADLQHRDILDQLRRHCDQLAHQASASSSPPSRKTPQ